MYWFRKQREKNSHDYNFFFDFQTNTLYSYLINKQNNIFDLLLLFYLFTSCFYSMVNNHIFNLIKSFLTLLIIYKSIKIFIKLCKSVIKLKK